MLRPLKTTLPLLAVLFMTVSCSSNPAYGGYSVNFLSQEDELDIGGQAAQQSIQEDGLFKDEKLQAYYKNLIQKLVKVSDRQDINYDPLLLDNGDLNAWAAPGYIAANRGVFSMVNSEAELAAVLSHEIGHIAAHHTARQISSRQILGGLMIATAVAATATTRDANAGRAAIEIGLLMGGVALAGFGRDYEREADKLSLRYMKKAGYDPREAYNLFHTFTEEEARDKQVLPLLYGIEYGRSKSYNIMASHPAPKERMNYVKNMVGKPDVPAVERSEANDNDTIGRDRYLRMIDGTPYGIRTAKGIVTRTRYINPGARFALSLPDGLWMQYNYGLKQWDGVDVASGLRITIGTTFSQERRSAEEVLYSAVAGVKDVERMTVDGHEIVGGTHLVKRPKPNMFMPTYIGQERIFVIAANAADNKTEDAHEYEQEGHRFYFLKVLTGLDEPRFTLRDALIPSKKEKAFDAKKTDMTPAKDLARRIVASFKAFDVKTAKAVEPLRIKVHTVEPGETVDSLAEKMAIGAYRKETFIAMNGLPDGYVLKPGQKVKLVIDPNTI